MSSASRADSPGAADKAGAKAAAAANFGEELSMKRRNMLASSLAASALAGLASLPGAAQSEGKMAKDTREFYELRRYQLRNGAQPELFHRAWREGFVPALNRCGIGTVGVFTGMVGPRNPSVYVLIPYPSFDSIAGARARLSADAELHRVAADYINAPSSSPAYERIESWLMEAFEGMPRLAVPAEKKSSQKRIFELRTYESHSMQAHETKLKMFNTGEIAIFRHNGLRPVFFGSTWFGSNLPNLTYMLVYADMAEHDKVWAAFIADPAWKKLSQTPGFRDAEIVSNISNQYLTPAPYSQL